MGRLRRDPEPARDREPARERGTVLPGWRSNTPGGGGCRRRVGRPRGRGPGTRNSGRAQDADLRTVLPRGYEAQRRTGHRDRSCDREVDRGGAQRQDPRGGCSRWREQVRPRVARGVDGGDRACGASRGRRRHGMKRSGPAGALAVAVSMGCVATPGPQKESSPDALAQAEELYARADYAGAARAYEDQVSLRLDDP